MISTYSAPRLCGLSMDDAARQIELLYHMHGLRYEHSRLDDAVHVIYDNQIVLTVTAEELEDFEPRCCMGLYYQAKIEIAVLAINAKYRINGSKPPEPVWAQVLRPMLKRAWDEHFADCPS